ncbi:MAG TPA: PDZ domain-containing protein, partial [bacterium]|nr:PDZ domain-containing protein [bacterium]
PWGNYARDYRPVIEYARANGLMVLCANAPKELVTRARKEGLDAVAGSPHVAREVTVPEDDGYDAFLEVMSGHPGVTEEDLRAFYVAQCVRDDTMGETIADWLQAHAGDSERPLVVLICGKQHSDYGRGVVQRVRNRLPDVVVKVLTAETVEDLGAGVYQSDRKAGDFVVVAREPRREPRALPPVAEAEEQPDEGREPEVGEGEVESLPTENPEGLRPALGFMPDYAGSEAGVGVGEVREGGPAAQAGIQQGDTITKIAGVEVADLQEYTDVLDGLIIGHTVTVHVIRGDAAFDTEVKVGSRPAH